MVEGRASRLTGLVKLIMKSEVLDVSTEVPVVRTRRAFIPLLFGSEVLPLDEQAGAGRRESFFGWLLGPEALPSDDGPKVGARRPSFFSTIFSRERLTDDSDEREPRGNRPAGR